jgi:hypothetical protein
MQRKGVIYKTTNLINGKIYIGQDKRNNPKYLGSGVLLRKSIEKNGKENFKKEILEECSSQEELNEREIYWIDKLNARHRTIGYNLASGGDGQSIDWFKSYPYKEEYRQRHSMLMKKICSDKNIREIRKINSTGKNNPGWLGYIHVFNPYGELIGIYTTLREASYKLKTQPSTIRYNARHNRAVQRGNLIGHTFKISKELREITQKV